jgi:diadenosine tetraphosphatase ApaH/serine/threonine PP2A family protein phosphatase
LKIFVCSDIHGNARALEAVLNHYETLSEAPFLFLGDCVGYGAHPDLCLDRILAIPRSTLILGNHDAALLSEAERGDLNEIAAEAIGWSESCLGGRYDAAIRRRFRMEHDGPHCHAVHGSPYRPDEWNYIWSSLDAEQAFFALEFGVCFVGHTHTPRIDVFGKGELSFAEGIPVALDDTDRYIINPGSVGQPRDGDRRAAFCLFDTDMGTITLLRCEYDVEAEARDIIEAGLPAFLGERLLYGS